MIKTKELPGFLYLHECFDYRPDGILLWNKRPRDHFLTSRGMNIFNSLFSGKVAGSITDEGYLAVKIGGFGSFKVHRIVYAMFYGCPDYLVDHRDGDITNNRIENLRKADDYQSTRNTKKSKTNKSGVKGINRHFDGGWLARVSDGTKRLHFYSKDFDLCVEWITKTRARLHGEYTNHGTHKSVVQA
jgi:hypothetical protein